MHSHVSTAKISCVCTARAVIPNTFSVIPYPLWDLAQFSLSQKGRQEHQEHPVILNNLLLKALPNNRVVPTDDIQGFYTIKCPLALPYIGSLFIS